jgi:hypothetical protein
VFSANLDSNDTLATYFLCAWKRVNDENSEQSEIVRPVLGSGPVSLFLIAQCHIVDTAMSARLSYLQSLPRIALVGGYKARYVVGPYGFLN